MSAVLAARRSPPRQLFYVAVSVAICVAVLVGFAPTYYLGPYFQSPGLPLLAHVHGAVFTAWIVLFLIQSSLVATRRVALHRTLGWAGAGVAAAVVIVGLVMAIASGRRHFAAGEVGALAFLATPLTDMPVFAAFTGLAIWYRRRPAVHKRLMFLATISMLGAAFARWPDGIVPPGPVGSFGAVDLFLVAAVIHDAMTLGRVHRVTLWGGLFLVSSQFLRVAIGTTAAWQAFARTLLS